MKSKKNLDVEKKIYICPNSATQNRNVRIDDNGTEIILNHVLNPWIIGQFFQSVTKYRKVASSNTSHFEAHAGLFRLLMKGIFDAYVL